MDWARRNDGLLRLLEHPFHRQCAVRDGAAAEGRFDRVHPGKRDCGAEGRTGAAGSRDEPLELGEPALLRGPTVLHQRRRAAERRQRSQEEQAIGIHHIDASGPVDVGIQIIELAKLDPSQFDPRLCGADGVCIDPRSSDAIIVNVNYPLGLAAYNIMTQIGMTTDELQGIYILGKAATLNGRIGDVMISDVVYDEHSGNTYWFENAFSYADLAPYLDYGAALDNQKRSRSKGPFSRMKGYLDFFYRENFTVVEMEAGRISTRSMKIYSCAAIHLVRPSICRHTGPERSIWGSSITLRTRPTPEPRRLEREVCPTTGWIRPMPRPWPSCAASFSRQSSRRNRDSSCRPE